MKNLSIKAKLLSIVISSIVIVSVIILIESNVALYTTSNSITDKFEKEAYTSKELELKNYVQIAVKTVESFYKKAQADSANAEQYKKDAIKAVEGIRYGKDGYYWINDSKPKMIMHPIKPSLNGKDLSGVKDPDGTFLFNDMVKVTSGSSNGGLVRYVWPKPGFDKPQQKFSYVIKFQPWDWIIGTGAYVDNIGTEVAEMKAETEEEIYDTMIKNIVIIVIIMFILAFIMLIISKKTIFDPLERFQNGLLSFFKYLNKEQTDVERLDDSSKDEIGTMSKEVNQNIEKTKSLIEQDIALIEDVKRVVGEVKSGYLDKKIQKTTQNEALQELQVIFNEMIEIMEQNVHNDINEVTKVLNSFKNRDFRAKIETPKGDVANTLNELSEIINKMLLENLTIGTTMNENSDILRGNVEQLSVSSNEQAASLEETAAALEEITSTITATSDNITQMSSYSDELTKSITNGQNLANETTASMEDINEQTQLIADAITVIDQIAFQTNILSLNAAVEAATAGEAGKGFAVVAQEVRNLAARSAEAAKEIKEIVENATSKADNGKEISSKMIEGYQEIYAKIQQTNAIITDIATASKEQTSGIAQINDAVAELDKATQENASVASNTSDIANQTSKMAIEIVEEANRSEFAGKNDVTDRRSKPIDLGYSGRERRQRENKLRAKDVPTRTTSTNTAIKPTKPVQEITPNNNDENDEWESF